jgi:hypothetical protein
MKCGTGDQQNPEQNATAAIDQWPNWRIEIHEIISLRRGRQDQFFPAAQWSFDAFMVFQLTNRFKRSAKLTDRPPNSAINGIWLAVFGSDGAEATVSATGVGITSAIGTSFCSGVSATMGSLLNSSTVAGSV